MTLNGGNANVRVIDILDNTTKDSYNLNLDRVNSEMEFSVATIAKNNVDKEYKIRSNNNASSEIKLDCFGISQDTSLIKYDVTSFIKKGAKRARVNQNSKILLFDKEIHL